jgi:hypothetical protein
MKISFSFDINDLFDVTMRAASRGRLRRPWDGVLAQLWSLLIAVPSMGWVVYSFTHPGAYPLVLAFAGIAGGLAQWYAAQARRTRVFDHLEYASGGRGPFRCEVELAPGGIVTRQFEEEVHRPWASVVAVRDTPSGVEVDFGRRGVLVVRPNGFASAAERDAFIRCIAEYSGQPG